MSHVKRNPFLVATAQDFRVGCEAAAIPGAAGLCRAAGKAELHFNVIEREQREAGSVHVCNSCDGPNGCACLE